MNLPGTHTPIPEFALQVHLHRKSLGVWDNDPPMAESLVQVACALTRAVREYQEDRILPQSFYRPTGPATPPEGVIVHLAHAVVLLLDLATCNHIKVVLWDGMDRHHTRFFPDIFQIINRVTRLKENYPIDAIPMIEKFAATWVSRAEFWGCVQTMAKKGVER